MNDTERLAGAKKPCPTIVKLGAKGWGVGDCKGEVDAEIPHECNGTGLVYVFDDSVRVPCPQTYKVCNKCGARNNTTSTDPVCAPERCDCHGKGWTASEDGWVWWTAAYKAELYPNLSAHHYGWNFQSLVQGKWECSDDPKAAFFAALLAAVERMEVQL